MVCLFQTSAAYHCFGDVSVSGLHARLEKRDGALFVTDLDSTNGTYVDDKKVRPGAVTPVFPGSYITFGQCASLPCKAL